MPESSDQVIQQAGKHDRNRFKPLSACSAQDPGVTVEALKTDHALTKLIVAAFDELSA